MATAQQDTEITLGTGRMLAIFFAFVLICAFFFAIGFSLGRRTTLAAASGWPSAPAGTPATVVRPSAAKSDGIRAAPQANSSDFSFYKAVGDKSADAALAPQDATSQTSSAPGSTTRASQTQPSPTPAAPPATVTPANGAADIAPVAPVNGGYYVQVAAVSRQEDAEALVEALKKKQYPAFSANNPAVDKFFRVQVGPYSEMKDAEAMRARLIGDGYNPIVKK
jgi:cell division septation protein DedD